MTLKRLARLSLLGSMAGLAIMLAVVVFTWQSLRADLDEIERLADIQHRAVELDLAVGHLFRGQGGRHIIGGIQRDVSQLRENLDQIEHHSIQPARRHLRELAGIVDAMADADRDSPDDSPTTHRAREVAATQAGIHLGGLSSALKTLLSERQHSIDLSLRGAMQALATLAIIFAAFSLMGFALIHRRISRPIESLDQAMAALQAGDLTTRVPELGNDEFGALAQSFNRMVESQQRQEEEIADYQARLESSMKKLQDMAYHDLLTGQLSRDGFTTLAGERLKQSDAVAHVIALNIAGMRDVNETHGYRQGDRLLRDVGHRLEDWVGDNGLVARVGGDEFAVCRFHGGDDTPSETQLAEEMDALFSDPFESTGFRVEIELRFGLAKAGHDAVEALRRAEIALFSVVPERLERWTAFTPDMEQATRARLEVTKHLRTALIRDEFLLEYQPQVNLEDGALFASEALIRWKHPEHGLQSPGQFIAIAERSKLIIPIGKWAMGKACSQLAAWKAAGLRPTPITVNVSLVQFLATDFVATVKEILEETDTAPGELGIEVTESVFDRHNTRLARQFQQLNELGVKLSLDDFGTGYSSLRYIREYPFSIIKLDRSFVSRLSEDAYSRTICEAVIRIGAELGTDIIAEGIETVAQRELLLELGCTRGQGFYYSRPLGEEAFRRLLESDSQRLPQD